MVFFHFQRILETELFLCWTGSQFCLYSPDSQVTFVSLAFTVWSGEKNKLLFNGKKSPASLSVVVCEKIGEAAGVDIHNTNTAANNVWINKYEWWWKTMSPFLKTKIPSYQYWCVIQMFPPIDGSRWIPVARSSCFPWAGVRGRSTCLPWRKSSRWSRPSSLSFTPTRMDSGGSSVFLQDSTPFRTGKANFYFFYYFKSDFLVHLLKWDWISK